jgi:hypothetical protein
MMHRFLAIFFATVIGGLLFVATINFAVDPYSNFRWTDIAGLNGQKHLKAGGGRINKSVILARQDFDTVLLGTSTTETGFDPRSAAFQNANAYDAALPFSNIYEMTQVARYVAAHQTPKRVIIGLDFAAFGSARTGNGDYADSGFAGRSLGIIALQRLLSAQSLNDSIGTVRDSVRKRISPFSKYGNYDPGRANAPVDFHAQFVASLDAYLTTYATFRYDRENLALLRDAVAELTQKGTQVVLFISPLHALHLDAIELAGLQPTYDAWKRDVTRLATDGGIALWDFSYLNTVTLDPVPPGKADGTMAWYWDAAHYKAATGDLIVCRMFGCPGLTIPSDFGIKLTVANIDANLLRQQSTPAPALADFSADLDRKARNLALR